MLDEKLKEYATKDIYPFHMPGHKRVALDEWNPYRTDITEIDGFDNLHEAREILLQEQKRAAKLYGAEESFYLVNGSTCGILAAISASVSKRGKILVARNSHKAVYNGILLRELDAVYAYPNTTRVGIQGQIHPQTIADLLQEHPDVEAVLITSPTYDGVVSDVEAIAEIAHQHRIPLIVDAAHGAHLGFSKEFPENPVKLGADVVIESVHKTLPAFTQTALLHLCSNRVSAEKIKRYLSIYETSSPSYILMAGIERCMEYMERQGAQELDSLAQKLSHFYERTKHLKHMHVLLPQELSKDEAYAFDFSKILIFSRHESVSGSDMHKELLEKYHIQMEMVSGQYVLALCSVMDTEEGFARLVAALEEMDDGVMFAEAAAHPMKLLQERTQAKNIYRRQKLLLPIYKVEELQTEIVPLAQAVGRAAGEYLYLYPPGIPVIVPGEQITQELIEDIKDCQKAGLYVEGLKMENRISVVNFS